MYILHRYIMKELFVTFLLAVVFLNSTLMMEKLMKLSKLLAAVGASVLDIGEIILYIQPQLMILTIPMALLLSVLLTYGRMIADSELVIMNSIGMPFSLVSRPVLYLGITFFLVNIAMSFYIAPQSSVMLRDKIMNILVSRAPLAIEEGIFNSGFKDMVILVREKPSPTHLSGIFIVDERNKQESKVIVAKDGRILTEADSLSFVLKGGNVYVTSKNTFTEIKFGSYYFKLIPSIKPGDRNISEYTPFELIAEAARDSSKRVQFLLEMQRRISMPALCLIIILLGPALSMIAGKSGRIGGLTVGLVIFAAYYIVMVYAENIAKSGTIPHYVGAWTSFALLSAGSWIAFDRVNRR